VKNFLAELKRRNVYKVAIAYAVIAVVMQIASQIFPFFEIPNCSQRSALHRPPAAHGDSAVNPKKFFVELKRRDV
jgi:hypothetical protein